MSILFMDSIGHYIKTNACQRGFRSGEAKPTEEYVGKTLTIYLLTHTKHSFVKHATSRFLVYFQGFMNLAARGG